MPTFRFSWKEFGGPRGHRSVAPRIWHPADRGSHGCRVRWHGRVDLSGDRAGIRAHGSLAAVAGERLQWLRIGRPPGSADRRGQEPGRELSLGNRVRMRSRRNRDGRTQTQMVGGRHRAQRRAAARGSCFRVRRSQAHRSLAEALRRSERQAQGRAVPIGDVDAELLHQPRRQEPAGPPQGHPRRRQGRIACASSTATNRKTESTMAAKSKQTGAAVEQQRQIQAEVAAADRKTDKEEEAAEAHAGRRTANIPSCLSPNSISPSPASKPGSSRSRCMTRRSISARRSWTARLR